MILNIEKLVHTGYGLARKGKVYFVPLVIPGETVEVSEISSKKDYSIAKPEKILEKSPHRIEAPCPYFGVCGGCQFQHIEYDEQLNQKKQILKETFQKIAKMDIDIKDALSDEPYFYRNKAKFSVKDGAVGFLDFNNKFIKIDSCMILSKAINEKIGFLNELAKHFNPNWIHIFYSSYAKEFLVKFSSNLFISKEKLKKFKEYLTPKDIVSISLVKDDPENSIIFSVGNTFIFIELLETKYRISVNSFFQTNLGLTQKLLSVLPTHPYQRVLDDFGGVGLFGLHLAKYAKLVEISDKSKSSSNDAEYSAKLNRFTNVSVYNQSSFIFLKKSLTKPTNLLVLDPPRTGLTKDEINLILLGKPEHIWYISCEPSSLARDISMLSKSYKIKEVYLLDMFPQTYHIETFVKLEYE